MTKSLSNTITLVLAGIGSVLAILLTVEYFHPHTLPCSVKSTGCAGTLASSYSHIGPIPISLLGLGMYLTLIALCVLRSKMLTMARIREVERVREYSSSGATASGAPSEENVLNSNDFDRSEKRAEESSQPDPLRQRIRMLDAGVWGLALMGACISWWLQYTSIYVICSFCPYCFTSALLVTTICGFASRDYLLDGRPLVGEQKLLLGVSCFVLVMLGFMAVPEAMSRIARCTPPSTPMIPTRYEGKREIVVRPNIHILGDPKAKYLLVEFADYLCPHCAHASKELAELLKQRHDISLAFRSYPLGLPHVKFPYSDRASEAAEAAALQGKFWEMHDYLFEHQDDIKSSSFNDEKFIEYAHALGLDINKFHKDMDSEAIAARVIDDHSDGDNPLVKVEQTPTIFLVTPTKITKFSGADSLYKVVKDPKNDVWK